MTLKKKIFVSILVWAVFVGLPALLLVSKASGKQEPATKKAERFDPVSAAKKTLSEQQLESIKDSYLAVVYEPEQRVCWLVRVSVGYGDNRFCANYDRD